MSDAAVLKGFPMTRHWVWGAPVIVVILVLDQLSKWAILNEPRLNALGCLDRSEPCGQIELSPIFDLTMLWNRGVSFGALQSDGWARWLLFILTACIAVAFAVWLLRAARWTTALAVSLIIGGAIGNLIDRARFGAVVDFLDFSGLYFVWVFNVADAAISVGAVLLLLDQFIMSRQSPD